MKQLEPQANRSTCSNQPELQPIEPLPFFVMKESPTKCRFLYCHTLVHAYRRKICRHAREARLTAEMWCAALTSLSSNNPESSHIAAPSPTPDFSEYPDAHSDHAADKDMSPEANAGSLHPTPSPYQDSNADPDLGQMIKVAPHNFFNGLERLVSNFILRPS